MAEPSSHPFTASCQNGSNHSRSPRWEEASGVPGVVRCPTGCPGPWAPGYSSWSWPWFLQLGGVDSLLPDGKALKKPWAGILASSGLWALTRAFPYKRTQGGWGTKVKFGAWKSLLLEMASLSSQSLCRERESCWAQGNCTTTGLCFLLDPVPTLSPRQVHCLKTLWASLLTTEPLSGLITSLGGKNTLSPLSNSPPPHVSPLLLSLPYAWAFHAHCPLPRVLFFPLVAGRRSPPPGSLPWFSRQSLCFLLT